MDYKDEFATHPWAEPFFTKMAESMIRNFLVIDWTTESQKAYFSLVKYVLNSIFQFTSLNARVGHRNRINIFDLIKLIRSLSIGHFELRAYLKWIKNHRTSIFPDDFFLNYHSSSTQNCKFDLTFCSDVIDTKKPGFEFFPPLPSSFTYKFTPIYGKREEEALFLLKQKTEERITIEDNLFKSIKDIHRSVGIVNYDDI